MALIRCSECGSDISEKASVCPKCGCPVTISKEIITTQKQKRIKNIVIGIIVLAVIAIATVVIAEIVNRPNRDGYYKNTKWGMTVEQVKKTLGDDVTVNKEKSSALDTIEDYDNKSGIDAMILFDCADSSLQKVTLILSNKDDSSYTDAKLIDEYKESFNDLYGEAKEDGITTFWNTSKSKIELSYLTDGMIIIRYNDITKVEK